MAYNPGCYCDFDCVQKTYWGNGADVGRKYWACPLENKHRCCFMAWAEEPLEERAVNAINVLKAKINKLEIEKQIQKWEIMDSHKAKMEVMKARMVVCCVVGAVLFKHWINVGDSDAE